MDKGRLEAFSDGMFAIILTIMVLELKAPAGDDLAALRPLWPAFLSYVLSFVYVAIYWNNHHHLSQAITSVNGRILWANQLLLFCLSLVPFVTHWMGQSEFRPWPVACYGAVMLCAALSYFVLTIVLVGHHGQDSTLGQALGKDFKGKVSLFIYAVAIPLAFVWSWVACGLYALVAVIWLIPDRRIERTLVK